MRKVKSFGVYLILEHVPCEAVWKRITCHIEMINMTLCITLGETIKGDMDHDNHISSWRELTGMITNLTRLRQ